jgi:hypothetical protein
MTAEVRGGGERRRVGGGGIEASVREGNRKKHRNTRVS